MSQPAITSRIRRLEDSVGAALLVRSVHGVVPTPAGERLAVHARELQSLLERAQQSVVDGTALAGRLSLAVSTTIAAHVLPQVLARFRKRHASVELRLKVGNTEEVIDAVRSGEFPLGLVEGHRRASGVRLSAWVEDALVPVVSPDARWTLRSADDLQGVPLLWREQGSGTRAVLVRALRQRGVRSKPGPQDLVLGTSEAIANAAAAGLGMGFLSRWSLGPYLETGRLRALPGLGLAVRRTFHWALPTGGLSGAEASFYEFAERNAPQLG
jgi:DNA-binding transcriptional LysR family regulator